jgi:hypothetical protein
MTCVKLILDEPKAQFSLVRALQRVKISFVDCEFTNYFSDTSMEIGPSYLYSGELPYRFDKFLTLLQLNKSTSGHEAYLGRIQHSGPS